MHSVRRTFAGAYQIMCAAAYLREGTLEARRSGKYLDLRNHNKSMLAEEMSILSTVIGVDQEVCSSRKLQVSGT